MAKMEKIRNTQVVDNKEDKFFYFPMISMGCTGSGYKNKGQVVGKRLVLFFFPGMFPLGFHTMCHERPVS